MHAVPSDTMHVLQVSAQVSTLRESLLAERAPEGPHACVLAKVVSQVAALFEDTSALRVLALEVELHSLGLWVLHSDGLVPLFRNAFESLVLASS